MQKDVLIVHHVTKGTAAHGDKFEYTESNFSVLDEVEAVAAALKDIGIGYRIEGVKQISDLPDVLASGSEKIVFNLVEDLKGHLFDLCYVPAICRAFGRACTGSDSPCLLLAQNKWLTKTILKASGLPCPNGVIVPVGKKTDLSGLNPGKYIVKPALADASEGIDTKSVVELPGESLDKAVRRIHKCLKQPAIVEQFVPSRELNISLLQQGGKIVVLPLAEIDFSAFGDDYPRIVDYSAKWLPDSFAYNNTPRIIPAPLSEKTAQMVRTFVLQAWQALGCRDFVRIDLRLDEKDNIFIIEVNPNPDISPAAGFAAALAAAAISYKEFIKILLDNSLARLGREYSNNVLLKGDKTNETSQREITGDKCSLYAS